MKTVEPIPETVPVTDFKARCIEYLRAVENGAPPIRITRHGKVIGVLNADKDSPAPPLLGAGLATGKLNPSYDPAAPAYDEDDWEINH
jgi:prevent-host-death family protein